MPSEGYVSAGSYPTGQAGEGANPEGERDKGEGDELRTALRKGPVNQRTSPNSTLTCLGRLDEYIYKQTVRCIRTPRAARRSASISRPSAFPADYDRGIFSPIKECHFSICSDHQARVRTEGGSRGHFKETSWRPKSSTRGTGWWRQSDAWARV